MTDMQCTCMNLLNSTGLWYITQKKNEAKASDRCGLAVFNYLWRSRSK